MFRTVEYNVNYRKRKNRTLYQAEFDIMHDFLASTNKNARLIYDTVREAKNATAAMRKYTKDARQSLIISQQKDSVIIFREEKEGVTE